MIYIIIAICIIGAIACVALIRIRMKLFTYTGHAREVRELFDMLDALKYKNEKLDTDDYIRKIHESNLQ